MIEIRPDIRPGVALLGNMQRQLPFAASKAINATLKDSQESIRSGLDLHFTIRSGAARKFMQRTILIRSEDWARKDKLKGTIRVDANQKGGRFDILSRFERGGQRTAHSPAFPFAIPTNAIRSNFGDSVPRTLLPSALGLVPRQDINGIPLLRARGKSRKPGAHVTGRGVVQLKGKNRTFVLNNVPGSKQWGVFKRVGPGPGDIRLIWAYRSKITIPPLLHFEETVRRVVANNWEKNWTEAVAYAIATAR